MAEEKSLLCHDNAFLIYNVYVICIYSPSLALDPEQLSARGGEAQYLVTPDSYLP